jgi:methyl-accepting chemotaxis protein
MDRKSFAASAKRVEEVDQVVRKLDPSIRASAFTLLRGYVGPTNDVSIDALLQIVLSLAAESAQEDLRALMREVQRINEQKSRLRDLLERVAQESEELAERLRAEYDDLFVSTEESEVEALRLQMAMDRRSKLLETLSNILKKMSDTESGIVSNLK